MRFVPKYLQVLGAAALLIGLFDALKTLLGAVYAYPGGVLVDRWGHRRALLVFNTLSILGYALVFLVPHWAAVILGMFLFLAWSNFSLPATFLLVGASLPAEQHAMGIGVQSLVKRAPILVGPILGGMLLDRYGVVGGVRIGLGASLVLGAIALGLVERIQDRIPPIPQDLPGFLGVVRDFDPRLRRLLLSDVLIRFCERIPYAWVVIYALDRLGVSATAVGVLTAVEMVTAIACYLPAAYFADRYGKGPFVIATFSFFTLFPLTMLAAGTFPHLLVAFVIRGLKEFGEPARKALIISYSRRALPAAWSARTT
jgi:MFS family permease